MIDRITLFCIRQVSSHIISHRYLYTLTDMLTDKLYIFIYIIHLAIYGIHVRKKPCKITNTIRIVPKMNK